MQTTYNLSLRSLLLPMALTLFSMPNILGQPSSTLVSNTRPTPTVVGNDKISVHASDGTVAKMVAVNIECNLPDPIFIVEIEAVNKSLDSRTWILEDVGKKIEHIDAKKGVRYRYTITHIASKLQATDTGFWSDALIILESINKANEDLKENSKGKKKNNKKSKSNGSAGIYQGIDGFDLFLEDTFKQLKHNIVSIASLEQEIQKIYNLIRNKEKSKLERIVHYDKYHKENLKYIRYKALMIEDSINYYKEFNEYFALKIKKYHNNIKAEITKLEIAISNNKKGDKKGLKLLKQSLKEKQQLYKRTLEVQVKCEYHINALKDYNQRIVYVKNNSNQINSNYTKLKQDSLVLLQSINFEQRTMRNKMKEFTKTNQLPENYMDISIDSFGNGFKLKYVIGNEGECKNYELGSYRNHCSEKALSKLSVFIETIKERYALEDNQIRIEILGKADAIYFRNEIEVSKKDKLINLPIVNQSYLLKTNNQLIPKEITLTNKIATNEQLAFLRAYAAKAYLSSQTTNINSDNIKLIVEETPFKGSKYRKVEIVIYVDDILKKEEK